MAHNYGVAATLRPTQENSKQSNDYKYQPQHHHLHHQRLDQNLNTESSHAKTEDSQRLFHQMPSLDSQFNIPNIDQLSSPSFQPLNNALSSIPPHSGSSVNRFASNGANTFWNTPMSGISDSKGTTSTGAAGGDVVPLHPQYRGLSIDSSIWTLPNPSASSGPTPVSSSSIWSPTRLNGHDQQQQAPPPQQQLNFTTQYFSHKQPPMSMRSTPLSTSNAENYTAAAVTAENRSSSISGFAPTSLEEVAAAGTTFMGDDATNSSPPMSFESIRRHSYTEGLLGRTLDNEVVSPTLTKRQQQQQPSKNDAATMQLVDDYFESDPHERVKVTMKLLNDRFFDEEKFLNDAYQLPKFPIESSLRNYQLVLVGFKAGRIDVFYLPSSNGVCSTTISSPTMTAGATTTTPTSATASLGQNSFEIKVGDLVIVEADRGRDLGKVFKLNVSIDEARLLKLLQFQEQQAALNEHVENNLLDDVSVRSLTNSQHSPGSHFLASQQQHHHSLSSSVAPPTLQFPKSILALAQPNEVFQILNKKQDEEKACRLCLAKISSATSGCLLSGAPISPTTQDLLQMKLIDAEYQFDRKKLIFYYSTSKRIDFRDLVRELFRIYKTRIWMCAVTGVPFKASRTSLSPLSTGIGATLPGGGSSTNNNVGLGQTSPSLKPLQQAQHPLQFLQRPQMAEQQIMSQPIIPTASSVTLQQQQKQQQQQQGLGRRQSFQQGSTFQNRAPQMQGRTQYNSNQPWVSSAQLQRRALHQPQMGYNDYQFEAIPRQISDSEQLQQMYNQRWSQQQYPQLGQQQQQQQQQQQHWSLQQPFPPPPQQQQQQPHTLGQLLTTQQQHILQVQQEAQKQVQDQFKRRNQGANGEDGADDDVSMMQQSSDEKLVLKSLVDSINH